MKENHPAVRVESGTFGSVVRCVTDGSIHLVHRFDGIFNRYKDRENAPRPLGKCLHRISQQVFAYIFYLVR